MVMVVGMGFVGGKGGWEMGVGVSSEGGVYGFF